MNNKKIINAKAFRALAMAMAVVTGVVFTPVTSFAEENEEIECNTEIDYEDYISSEEITDSDVVGAIEADSNGFSYELLNDGTYSVVSYDGYNAWFTIPGDFNGRTVTEIGDNFLYNKPVSGSVQQITIPTSIVSIGKNAFRECTQLSSITWGIYSKRPNPTAAYNTYTNLRIIDDYAFYGDSKITTVDISVPGVTTIGSYAFANCEGITKLSLPKTLSEIGNNAFDGCKSFSLDFAGEVKEWLNIDYETNQKGTHPNCYATSIRFAKETFVNWGERNYEYYTPTSLTVDSNVEVICAYAFKNFKQLTTVVINGPDEIGSYAFSTCSSLTSLTIHNSVEVMGQNLFYETDILNNGTVYVHENSKAHVALKSLNGKNGVYFHYVFLEEDGCGDGGGSSGGGGNIGGDIDPIPIDPSDPEELYTLNGYVGTFNGALGLKCYYTFKSSVSSNANAYVHFDIPDGNNGYSSLNIKVSEAKREGDFYVFTISLLPKEADSKIKSCVYVDGTNHGIERSVTYYDYLKKVKDANEFGSQNQGLYVSRALITYCDATQRYFGYHYGNVDLDGYKYTETEIKTLKGMGYKFSGQSINDKDYLGCNLVLEDTVSLRLYFAGQKSFTDLDETHGIYSEYSNGITTFTIKNFKFGGTTFIDGSKTYYGMNYRISFSDGNSSNSIVGIYSYFLLASNTSKSDLVYLVNAMAKLDDICMNYIVKSETPKQVN